MCDTVDSLAMQAMTDSLHKPACVKALGYSLITTMIALFVFTFSTAATMQVITLNIQSEAQTYSDEVSTDIRSSIELMQDITLGAGAGIDAELGGPQSSVKLCTLQTASTGWLCTDYNAGNRESLCMVATAHNLPNEPAGLQARGIRLTSGQMQYKKLENQSKGWAGHRNFCQDEAGWVNVNITSRYQVSQLRLCNLDSTSADTVNLNFGSRCDPIVDSNQRKNRGWMIEILATEPGSNNRPHRYFAVLSFQNSTRVEPI